MRLKFSNSLDAFWNFGNHFLGSMIVFLLVLGASSLLGSIVGWMVAHEWLHGYQKSDAEMAEWILSKLDLYVCGLYWVCETIKLARVILYDLYRNLRGHDD